jgi:hypothetical protein
VIVAGFALSETVGAAGGGAFIVTVALAVTVPPAPVTVIVYVVVCVGETLYVPLGWTVPILLSICADVAFVDVHVSVEPWPELIAVGLALSETVGAGAVDDDDD